MSSPRRPSSAPGRTTPRRLPASVYWRRRIFVLSLAASLVFVIASWLTGGSDARDGNGSDDPVAQQAGAQVGASTAGPDGSPGADGASGAATAADLGATPGAKAGRKGKKKAVPTPTPTLAAPQGVCDPADVRVTPAVAEGSVAGRDIAIGLSLQTVQAEACTWKIGPKSLTVRIADGGKEIWTTRHCPRAVPKQPVVVRRAAATVVAMGWNARESDEGCRRATEWVLPGDYSIAAAALGGEPVETTFALAAPARETVTVTPKPKPTKKPRKPRN